MTTTPTDRPETMLVTGMTWNHCAQSVTTALTTLDGITDVHVDLSTGRVSYRNLGGVERDRIVAAVRHAGFEPQ